MNYLKLLVGDRDGAQDPVHLPARINQADWTVELEITPDLSNRLAPEQIREFRFRGVPKLDSAINTGIEASGEFSSYFTGPAIIGVDFLNVYSNAIFFSEQGDGQVTSFHERGTAWMNIAATTDIPTGIYYKPEQGSDGARYEFTIYEDAGSGSQTYTPFVLGSDYGISLTAQKDLNLWSGTEIDIYGGDQTSLRSSTVDGLLYLRSKNMTIDASGWIDMSSSDTIQIYTGSAPSVDSGDVHIGAADDVKITAQDDVFVDATNDVRIDAEGGHLNLIASDVDGIIYLNSPRTGDTVATHLATDEGGVVINRMPTTGAAANIAWSSATGRLHYSTSSKRYKKDIQPINSTSWIHLLNPISFKSKSKEEGDKRILGLIAEEVVNIQGAEGLVDFDAKGRPNAIQYTQLIAPIIKELQDQRKEINELKAQLAR
jgi:hypothetical protein